METGPYAIFCKIIVKQGRLEDECIQVGISEIMSTTGKRLIVIRPVAYNKKAHYAR